jgi:RNA polymerase primary sigma factor
VRLPVHAVDSLARVQKARRTLESSGENNGQPATPEQIADHLEITVKEVKRILEDGRMGNPVSLSQPLKEDSDTELGDLVGDGKSVDGFEQVEFESDSDIFINALRTTLGEREFTLITERYGLIDGQPKTLEEVGKILDLTRERIRQIEARSFCKLRHPAAPSVIRAMINHLS